MDRTSFKPTAYPRPRVGYFRTKIIGFALTLVASALITLLATQSGCDSIDAPRADAMALAVEGVSARSEVAHWSGWRGGSWDGVSPANPPVQWTATEGVCWRNRVPGQGNSSPIVWGDKIFLTTEESNELSLLCFCLHSGELQWRQTLAASTGQSHGRNGHASATPVTDGEVVVVAFANALHALTLEGVSLWTKTLPAQDHEWGAASSPVICGNAVIQLSDGAGVSQIASFSLADGGEFWRTAIKSDGSWSTPLVVCDKANRPKSVVVNGTGSQNGEPGSLLAFDILTGAMEWSVKGTSDIACPTALLAGNLVVSSTGSNGPIFAVEQGSGQVAWRLPAGGAQVPTGVVVNDRLYLISDHGTVTCHRPEDGEVLWKHRLQGKFSASLIAASDKIYATNENGNVFVFEAQDKEYRELGASSLHEACFATPAAIHDKLVFRTETHLWCMGHPSTVEPSQPLPSPSTLAGGRTVTTLKQPIPAPVASEATTITGQDGNEVGAAQ